MEKLFGLRGFYNWDVLAGEYFTHPDLYKDRQCQVISNAEDLKTGFLQIVSERDKGYILSIHDPPKTVDEAVDRLISDLDLSSKSTIANMDLIEITNKYSRQFVYIKNALGIPANQFSGNTPGYAGF